MISGQMNFGDKHDGSTHAGLHGPGSGRSHDGNCRYSDGELSILLIEDSERLRVRLVELLDEPGTMHVTATAETELEAVQRISEDEYDVLLVDVELRAGSGIGAIRYARATYPRDRQPLIIVLTNYALPAVRARCMAAGANHFLDKMRQFQDVKPLIVASCRPPS
ncbi:MAG: response regulator transcription factor [Gammaproteobacteria bacterium]